MLVESGISVSRKQDIMFGKVSIVQLTEASHSGGILMTTKIVPLARRAAYLGIMSGVLAIAAIEARS